MTNDYNDLLMGGGGKSAKFEAIGDTVIGLVFRVDRRQRTEIGSGTLMTWPDGNPKMQLVITMLTEAHEDEDDDGMRNLYVPIPSQMQKSIADAIRKTGQTGIAVNGKLGVKFTKTEEPKTRGFSPQKIYTASYAAPEVSAEAFGQQEEDFDLPF